MCSTFVKADNWKKVLSMRGRSRFTRMFENMFYGVRVGHSVFIRMFKKMRTYSFARISFNMFFLHLWLLSSIMIGIPSRDLPYKMSFISSWSTHPLLIKAVADNVRYNIFSRCWKISGQRLIPWAHRTF